MERLSWTLGEGNPDVVVLDADLGNSTMSRQFQDKYPQRYFEMGIAEADMTSTAAGLAASGKIPFTNSFAVFSGGRAFDQIRQTIAIGKLNVKICGSSAGLSDFGDGVTHQSVEDMAIMRAIPNMTVLSPADGNETYKVVKAMAAMDGPCYIRVNRNDYDNVTAEDAPFVIGQPTVLREGKDVTVFATGYMVSLALQAAEQVEDKADVSEIFRNAGMKTQILTPFECGSMTKLFSKDRANKYFEHGMVVFFAGGTGHPYFSTDTGIALRAIEMDADCILLAKAIDGVYDSDPKVNPAAKKYDTITIQEVIDKQLAVVDLTASIMCMEHRMPMAVFSLNEPDGIANAMQGRINGTIVTA